MNQLSIIATAQDNTVTMTSLEIVDFINAHRKAEANAAGVSFPSKGFAKLQHKDFLAKVPEVLGVQTSAKFSADLPDSYGRLQPAYRFPKREATLMAMSYSYALQAAVYDHMTALENKLLQRTTPVAPAIANTPLTNDIAALELAARVLNVSESSKLGMVRHAFQHHAPHLLPALPAYAIDAPATSTSGSSEPTASATELLKKHGVGIGAAKFNKLLEQHGYLETRTRQSSSGTTKTYKAVTDKGLVYGKNITSASNPRETQPHWYVGSFGDLLEVVGV